MFKEVGDKMSYLIGMWLKIILYRVLEEVVCCNSIYFKICY
jgi:hypothetical protein